MNQIMPLSLLYKHMADLATQIIFHSDHSQERTSELLYHLTIVYLCEDARKGQLGIFLQNLIRENDPKILSILEEITSNIETCLNGDNEILGQFYEALVDGYYLIGRLTECFDLTKRWLSIHTHLSQNVRGFALANHTMGALYHVFERNLPKAEEFYKIAYDRTLDFPDLALRDMMIYNMANINQHHKGDYVTAYP
jgi:hypothetical protein